MIRAILALALAAGVAVAEEKAPAKKEGGLAHVVLFTMKKGTPATAVDEVIADCHKILSKIPGVRSVKAGRATKDKAEKFVKTDYDVALIVVVDDYEGLKAYHVAEKHVEFVKKHGKLFDLAALRVYDFTDGK